jgi:ankyrin repeat protein
MFLGHDMNVSDFDGRTPIHLAAAEGHLECVKFLLTSCDVTPDPHDRLEFVLNYKTFSNDLYLIILTKINFIYRILSKSRVSFL